MLSAEDRDAVDQHQRQLEDDEVLHEQRDDEQQRPASPARCRCRASWRASERPRRPGASVTTSSGCAHDQTRFTMGRPNRPRGLDDQHGDDQRKRDRQLQLAADTGNVGAGEVLDDADQEAADAPRRPGWSARRAPRRQSRRAARRPSCSARGTRPARSACRRPRRSRPPCPSRARSSSRRVMPTSRADSGFAAAARIARPIRV